MAWLLQSLSEQNVIGFQAGKVLANDPSGRAQFVHSGGLAAVQQMAEAPGSKLKEVRASSVFSFINNYEFFYLKICPLFFAGSRNH